MALTDEERRSRDAERKRNSRAAAKAERDAKAAASKDAPDAVPRISMQESVRLSVGAMKWIELSDKATVDLALANARLYDELIAADPSAYVKASTLSNLILRALAELAATPRVRLQHEVRSRKLQKPDEEEASGGDSSDGEAKSTAKENVTPIRPPRRRPA